MRLYPLEGWNSWNKDIKCLTYHQRINTWHHICVWTIIIYFAAHVTSMQLKHMHKFGLPLSHASFTGSMYCVNPMWTLTVAIVSILFSFFLSFPRCIFHSLYSSSKNILVFVQTNADQWTGDSCCKRMKKWPTSIKTLYYWVVTEWLSFQKFRRN